jgi:adenylate kinase family enzyme
MIERDKQREYEAKFATMNVVLFGLPGCGKTTLIEGLVTKPNYLSLGVITRQEVAQNGPMAEDIKAKFANSNPWNPDFVVDIIAPHIFEAQRMSLGFVLDGVPRNKSEAESLIAKVIRKGIHVDILLHLQVSEAIALQRIAQRDNSGRLETSEHYQQRIRKYLAEEDEILNLMKDISDYYLSIDTVQNPDIIVRQKLLKFVGKHF